MSQQRAGPPGVTLVVVESPAKGKTIQRWLGPGHRVMATMGHLLDLPENVLGVEVERGFLPRYEVLKGKNRLLSDLKRAARGAGQVLLATDPDREGEAIAWLLAEELGAPGGSPRVRRVLLHELTPEAIREAVASPCDLDRRRFEAQQARRILDRLVGWQVSPLLWARVRRGLSAGRVQSVAVRLVVERERERQAFVAEERWGVEVALAAVATPPGAAPSLRARLVELDGRPARPASRAEAAAAAQGLQGATYTVVEVLARERRSEPPPAFTTAALQQVAAAELGLSPRRTMALAQRLYEGVELGEDGAVGLVSYVRSDSTWVSPAAAAWGRAAAEAAFGREGLAGAVGADRPVAAARGAHEAIRPTSPEWPPERVGPLLKRSRERDLPRLYRLIWDRFVASLMAPAVHQEVTVRVAAAGGTGPPAILQLTGAAQTAPGWLMAHGDEPPGTAAGGPASAGLPALPALAEGQPLAADPPAVVREVTAPPPRLTEATLVQALEARGLGRPSTFAGIVDTVQARGYVERLEKRLAPTALGLRVTEVLSELLPRQLDVAFSAGLEAELDRIEEGTAGWQAVVAGFHGPLREALARAEAGRPAGSEVAIPCEACGRPMAVRFGRAGEFLACTGYPACRATRDLRREGGVVVAEPALGAPAGQPCPTCGAPLVARRGRYGRFLACSRFPACDGKVSPSLGVACPRACGGEVTERRSKRGKAFFGCSRWPACDFVSWDRPRNEPCPDCGSPWLVEAVSRRAGPVLACPDKGCGYRRPLGGAP